MSMSAAESYTRTDQCLLDQRSPLHRHDHERVASRAEADPAERGRGLNVPVQMRSDETVPFSFPDLMLTP
jgi:hypothetical protein